MDKFIAIVGLLILGLSPSFIDWQQSPELRPQIAVYYLVGITFVLVGLDGWIGGR
jgi:hypothetical protein